MAKELNKYSYFDTPDGQDTFKKLWAVLKPATMAALSLSTIDVMMYSKPVGYGPILARYAYISAPVLGASTAFVLTTNLSASIRKQDDLFNWALGGAAAGAMVGVWRKSPQVGFGMAAIFAGAAIVKKYAKQQGWVFVPEKFNASYGGFATGQYDWTLTKFRPGNWTTGK